MLTCIERHHAVPKLCTPRLLYAPSPQLHPLPSVTCSVAEAADQELQQGGKRPEKLGDCGDQLRKCFSVSLQAPGEWWGGLVGR